MAQEKSNVVEQDYVYEKPQDYKRTTGLVGVEVEPFAREILIKLYEKGLKNLADTIEENTPYRDLVETRYKFRLEILHKEKDVFEIERLFGESIQLEQYIEAARDELELIKQMAKNKPWEAGKWHTINQIYSPVATSM